MFSTKQVTYYYVIFVQGKDLSAVNGLLKRHNLTEANILENRERVDNLIAEGQVLIDGGHFDSDGITHSSDALNARYVHNL